MVKNTMIIKEFRRLFILFIILIIIITGFSSYIVQASSEEVAPYDLKAAGDIQYDLKNGLIYATKDVSFKINNLNIECQKLKVNLAAEEIIAEGGIKLILKDETLIGKSLVYNYGTGSGTMVQAKTKIDSLNFRGGVIRLVEGEEYRAEIEDASFTPCILDEPHYQIKAKRVKIYPDEKVVGEDVGFWIGKVKIISLPGYVVEYKEDEKTGKKELYNTSPVPSLGYNTEDGLILSIYYPYQYGNNLEGKLNASTTQVGGQKAILENRYKITPDLVATTRYVYSKEFEDDEINKDSLLKGGLSFKRNRLKVTGLLGYDFIDEKRQEELDIKYRYSNRANITLYHGFTNEMLEQQLYKLDGHIGRYQWELKYNKGYDIDSFPFIRLYSPRYNLNLFNLKFITGGGRVTNKGITTDKGLVKLLIDKKLRLATGLDLTFQEKVTTNLYYKDSSFSDYKVYDSNLGIDYGINLGTSLDINSNLKFQMVNTEGDPFLPDDTAEEVKLLKPGLSFKYKLPEPGSMWILKLNGSYNLYSNFWESGTVLVQRNYDCFNYSLEVDLVNESLGVNINF